MCVFAAISGHTFGMSIFYPVFIPIPHFKCPYGFIVKKDFRMKMPSVGREGDFVVDEGVVEADLLGIGLVIAVI